MTKIPLRVYLQEIEAAIDEGQYDEAVAHCRHILKTFPKHIASYRKLGKAYLEAQKYSNAADIFERVLSAVPDDFVAHVGMSIIREDEGNIETSVWHMERAFETQPYNPAVQGEIKRLYGKRDGLEPAKARLTQGALARMYAKGGHYKQAIAEFRNSLAQDSNRPDLQVPLAEMYAQSDQQVEAIQICSTVLRNLPYCLRANRLLAQLLRGTEREDERQKCLQRLYALDPYEAHISEQVLDAEDVPDQAVTIERLYWDGSGTQVEMEAQPDWGSSSSIGQSASLEEGTPDWLSAASEDTPGSEEPVFPVGDEEEEIPPWMKDAGWGPSSGEFDEQAASGSFSSEDDQAEDDSGDAIEADLPDWIKDMAPTAGAAAAVAADSSFDSNDADEADKVDSIFSENQPDPTSDDILDWLQDIEIDSPDTLPEPDQQPDAEEDSLPEWMQSKSEESSQPAEDASDPLDWLSDLQEESETKEVDDDLPDWLSDSSSETEPDLPVDEPDSEESIPGWLKGVDEEESAIDLDEEVPVSDSESGGVTDFLQGLQPDAQQEPVEVEPSDWLQDSVESPTEEIQTPPAEIDENLEAPDFLHDSESETPIEQQSEGSDDEDDSLEWLNDLTAESKASDQPEAVDDGIPDWLEGDSQEAATPPQPEAADDDIPDWLKTTSEEPDTLIQEPEIQQPDAPVSQADESLEWLADETTPQPGAEAEADDDIPDWLKTTSEEPDTPIQEPEIQQPDAPVSQADESLEWLADETTPQPEAEADDDIPYWLKTTGEEAAIDEIDDQPEPDASPIPAAEVQTEETISDDMPDWLKGLEEASAETLEEVKSQPDSDIPDWLDNLAGGEILKEPATEVPGQKEMQDTKTPDEKEPPEEVHSETKHRRITASLALETGEDEGVRYPSHEGIMPEEEETPKAQADFPEWLAESESKETDALESKAQAEDPDFPEWLAEPTGEEASAESDTSSEFEDADAAMAWLEGLAAKQGVSEEELISSPDERPETPPEWVQEETQQTEPKPTEEIPATDDIPDWLKEVPAKQEEVQPQEAESEVEASTPDDINWLQDEPEADEIPEAEPILEEQQSDDVPSWLKDVSDEPVGEEIASEEAETTPEFEDADATMAWLEGLAAKQGVSEEELISSPDERPETPPEWVQESIDEGETISEPAAEAETILESDAQTDAISETEAEAVADRDATIETEDVPEWLQEGAFAPPVEHMAETIETTPVKDIQPEDTTPVDDEITLPSTHQESVEIEAAQEEDTPDWLKDLDVEKTQETVPAEETDDKWIVPGDDELEVLADGEDDIPDWLKEMRAEEATVKDPEPVDGLDDEVEIASEADVEPGLLELDEISSEPKAEEHALEEDKLPDWLQDTAIAVPPDPVVDVATGESDQAPDWVKAEAEAEAEAEAVDEPDRPDDATWIREIGKDVPSFELETPPDKPQPEEILKEELPDRLQDFDSDEAQPETSDPNQEYTWQLSGAEAADDAPSEEKLDLNTASLIQMERLPGMGFSRAQIIFSHREEYGPFSEFEELLKLPGITPDTLNSIQDYIEIKTLPEPKAVAAPETKPAPPMDADAAADLAPVAIPDEIVREPQPITPIEDAEDQHHAKQIEAQQMFAQGAVSEAMAGYAHLIKKGKRLDEIIEDLKTASLQQPQNAEILQTMGDAYMRADHLQEALDTYSKAENLLQ